MTQENTELALKDLVILKYASNTCCTTVCSAESELPDRLRINPEKGEWTFDGRQYKIGTQMRHCEHGCKGGVIGVYDRREVQHLNTMVHHGQEALKRPMSFYEAEYA